MNKVSIVYRGGEDVEILGIFEDRDEASRYCQEMAETRYEGERVWVGEWPVPYRITEDISD